MSNALATLTSKLAKTLDIAGAVDELLSVLKATAFKGGATDAQMTALMIVADQYGLNPWTKEIYAFPDKQHGVVPVVGVDGWSRIINTNPQFDGIEFEQDDESCTCIIYRKDRSHATRVTEYMSECLRPPFKSQSGHLISGPWQSHPRRMLRHKAMIQCSRIAFGFVGIFDQDEAERFSGADVVCAERVYSADTSAIDSAETMQHLQIAFSSAWKSTTDKAEREAITAAKDKRKKELSRPVMTDTAHAIDMETGEVISDV